MLFKVVCKLAIEVLLSATFIVKEMLRILNGEWKVPVCDSNQLSTVQQGGTPAVAVLKYVDTKNVVEILLYKTGDAIKKNGNQSTVALVTNNAHDWSAIGNGRNVYNEKKGLLLLEPNYNLVIR